jgi:hypothetical protein
MNSLYLLKDDLIKGINEVDEMLKFNIVQGKLNERGNYGKLTQLIYCT